MFSAVLIIPDTYREEANTFGVQQGWGDNNFSVALSADGKAPATQWGCRADVTQSFVDRVESGKEPLTLVLVYSFNNLASPYDHWTGELENNNLMVVQGD